MGTGKTPPTRLSWPLSANQITTLDQMTAELYKRTGLLFELIAGLTGVTGPAGPGGSVGPPGGPSGNIGVVQGVLSGPVDVGDVDGLLGEMMSLQRSSFATGGGGGGSSDVTLAQVSARVVLGI